MESVLTTKVGDMDWNTREAIIKKMKKEMVSCIQDVVVKKKSLVQFKDGQKR